ncbi:MAG: dienelactone hydrolase family protein [Actinomycetota bacterium]|nr:dienelactone hydrolase family protein [Actinomycetota bacterium]
MCYETDARPPLPPISGGASAQGSALTLEAKDGNRFSAFESRAVQASNKGVVILPDVRGLHAFYEDLALRFGDTGVNAVAIDYFGRTAGLGTRDDSFEFMPHVMQTQPDTVSLDTAAAVAHLRDEIGCTDVFTMGFCFGGRSSFNQAGRGHGLAGVIGFYGRVAAASEEDANAPIDLVETYDCKVLGLFGGADPSIPVETIDAFRKAMEAKGLPNEIQVYEGAPHSFFDRSFTQFKEQCDDAWHRILGFIGASGAGGA